MNSDKGQASNHTTQSAQRTIKICSHQNHENKISVSNFDNDSFCSFFCQVVRFFYELNFFLLMCTNDESCSTNNDIFGALMTREHTKVNGKRAPVISMVIDRVPLERFQNLKCTLMLTLKNAHWYNFRRFSHRKCFW